MFCLQFNHVYLDPLKNQYNMPHWINLSFYSSKKRFYSNFIPRIKMPNILQSQPTSELPKRSSLKLPSLASYDSINSETESEAKLSSQTATSIDFDEYDNQIFKTSNKSETKQLVILFVFLLAKTIF